MATAKITVCLDEPIGTIRPEIYGHFAEHLGTCVEEGLWVGEDSKIPNLGGLRSDVIDALRKIRPPVLRWPGGCFADDYHWEDGVGPRRERPRRVNLWWGQTVENNAFGTHEFIALCRAIGAEPYLAGNVGSGTPRELRDWMEYCNYNGDSTLARRRANNGSPQPFGVRYWGVGNENWGCGGNMCPEDYAAEFKRYSTYLGAFGGTQPFLVACGPNGNDADWTRRFFKKLGTSAEFWNRRIHGYAAHYYTWNREGAYGTATEFTADQWYGLLHASTTAETVITTQRALMDEFDPQRKIGLLLDEWGVWHPPTPGKDPALLWEQNSLRDAVAAAMSLDSFNRHADKVIMTNVAQIANVLHSLILTDGPRMTVTPTYHVFDLYQSHQGGRSVRTVFEAAPIKFAAGEERKELPSLSGSASVGVDGSLTVSVVNAHTTLPAEVTLELRGGALRGAGRASVLTHDELSAHNTFEETETVRPSPTRFDEPGAQWRYVFPPASVTVFNAKV